MVKSNLIIASLIVAILGISLTTEASSELTSNSIQQQVSKALADDGCCILGVKETITDNVEYKTSYKVEHILLGETVGTLNMWSDEDYDKNINHVEVSTSHFNDEDSEVVAWVLLNILQKGISESQIDNDVFFDMADEVDNRGESSIVTTNGHKAVLKETVVIEGTPGLTFLTLNIDYNLDAVVSTKPQTPIENNQEVVAIPSESQEEIDAGRVVQNVLIIFGIPGIIIWLIIRKIKKRKQVART